jgi:drug/metabolite transporter (DMT)-like permease
MIKTYSASKLSAFTFVTPLFGVAAGYFILGEPLTAAFGAAAVLVTAGLYLVNRPAPHTTDPLLKPPKT